jgi:hypothetical protein
MIEGNLGLSWIAIDMLVRPNADPSDFARYAAGPRLDANAPDPNHRIKEAPSD